jgi:hypothetical protein
VVDDDLSEWLRLFEVALIEFARTARALDEARDWESDAREARGWRDRRAIAGRETAAKAAASMAR